MPRFLVEVYAPKSSRLTELAAAARAAAKGPDGGIWYVDSILVPEDETCFHVFEGPRAAAIAEAAVAAGLPFQRVVKAVGHRRHSFHARCPGHVPIDTEDGSVGEPRVAADES